MKSAEGSRPRGIKRLNDTLAHVTVVQRDEEML